MSKVKNTIYNMLTENTGIHMLDSGGENGRGWQRNIKKTLADFEAEDFASVELSLCFNQSTCVVPNISLFHYLSETLALDKICDTFNKKDTPDWDSDYPHTSQANGEWLDKHFEPEGRSWNTYNWDCSLSQDIHGQILKHKDNGGLYLIFGIHNGCDARGGYTNAKLFKLRTHYFLDEFISCEHFDIRSGNEVYDHEGNYLQNDDLLAICKKLNIKEGDSKTFPADCHIDCDI